LLFETFVSIRHVLHGPVAINKVGCTDGCLLMTHTALHARCVIVEPSAMMHVQNYAGIAENAA